MKLVYILFIWYIIKIETVITTETGTNITFVAVVNAGGGFIPLMLFFSRVNFKDFRIKRGPSTTIGGQLFRMA